MKFNLRFLYALVAGIVCSCQVGNVEKPGEESLKNLDEYFVQQYSVDNVIIGKITRPVILINGFQYQLLLPGGGTETFNDLINPFNELKAVSHIGPALYAIGSSLWNNPNSIEWKKTMVTYRTMIDDALEKVNDVDWSNPAWPDKADELKTFMHDALQFVVDAIDEIIQKGTFSEDDYQNFAGKYLHTMVATMYLADVANTTAALKQLNQWKTGLGEEEWDKLYVLVMGSKGRFSAGLTVQTNTAAYTISQMMKPELAKTHVLVLPGAQDIDSALNALGATINAKKLSALTFLTPEAQKISGLSNALERPEIPLAMQNVKRIILQAMKNDKIALPEMTVTPSGPIAPLKKPIIGTDDASLPPVTVTTLPPGQDTGVKLLQFALNADLGEAILTDPSQGLYTLTLKHTHKRVSFMTNAPRRIVGTMATAFFLKRWDKPAPHDFATTPPNLMLFYTDATLPPRTSGVIRRKVAMLQVMSPRYDQSTGILTLQVKPVDPNLPLKLPKELTSPILSFASPAVCGLLGSWGNLPGETQYNPECHTEQQEKLKEQ